MFFDKELIIEMKRYSIVICLVFLLGGIASCSSTIDQGKKQAPAPEEAVAPLALQKALKMSLEEGFVPPKPTLLTVSIIVVVHRECKYSSQTNPRTKEAALARAGAAMVALESGRDFSDVAREYSDHATGISGGNVGNVADNRIDPKLAKAVKAMAIGEISAEPLDLQTGYYIVKRQELRKSLPLSASLVLVAHDDSSPKIMSVARSKEEALVRAKEVIVKIRGGSDFAEVAKAYSDHPTGAKGGMLGVFMSDKAPQAVADEVESLKVGEVSGELLDTPLGYLIMKRHQAKRPALSPKSAK